MTYHEAQLIEKEYGIEFTDFDLVRVVNDKADQLTRMEFEIEAPIFLEDGYCIGDADYKEVGGEDKWNEVSSLMDAHYSKLSKKMYKIMCAYMSNKEQYVLFTERQVLDHDNFYPDDWFKVICIVNSEEEAIIRFNSFQSEEDENGVQKFIKLSKFSVPESFTEEQLEYLEMDEDDSWEEVLGVLTSKERITDIVKDFGYRNDNPFFDNIREEIFANVFKEKECEYEKYEDDSIVVYYRHVTYMHYCYNITKVELSQNLSSVDLPYSQGSIGVEWAEVFPYDIKKYSVEELMQLFDTRTPFNKIHPYSISVRRALKELKGCS